MPPGDTVDRILDAATVLFAERGFAETSLRTITSTADVNLAAVNYHFGSKKELIQAVFARFMGPFCNELDRQMALLEADIQSGKDVKLERILFAALKALLTSTQEIGDRPQRFMRLVNLSYSQSQEHLRQYMVTHYQKSYGHFIAMIKRTMPEMDSTVFYWRLYFMLGAAVFNLSSYDPIRAILQLEYHEDTSLEEAIDLLVPSLVGILEADNAK